MSSLVRSASREGRVCASACLLLASLFMACTAEIDATNAFDPKSTEPARGALRGVVQKVTGELVAGVEVQLLGGPAPVAPAISEADGAFTFGSLRPGAYDVVVRSRGFREVRLPREVGIGETLDVGTLLLEPISDTFVTGFAKLEERTDHTGISVTIVDTLLRTTTTADGSFILEAPEGEIELSFTYPEFLPRKQSMTVVGGQTTALDEVVTLDADPAVLTGTVVGRDCRTGTLTPLEGATVSPGAGLEAAVTAVDGTFQLLLPGGVWTLDVGAPRYDRQLQQPIEIRGGERRELGELSLQASRGSIEGHALLFGRTDHAGTLVQLADAFVPPTITNAEGRFVIEQVCEGEGFELRATPTASGFLPVVRSGLRVVADEPTVLEDFTLPIQRGGLVLAEGSAYSQESTVAYSLDAVPGTTRMRFSDVEAAIEAAAWEPFAPIGTVALAPGEGLRQKFAQTEADGAASAVFRAAVIVDRTPPAFPTLTIEDGELLSNDPDGAVQLELLASEAPAVGVDQTSGLSGLQLYAVDLQAGEAGPVDPADPRWAPAVTPVIPYRRVVDQPLLRPNDDEEKELWARFLDAAGNPSAPISARVTLDRVAPSGAALEVRTGTPGYVRSSVIDLALTIADAHPGVQVRVANGPDLTGAAWQPVLDPPLMTWFLPQLEGVRTIHAQFRDAAGNLSAQVSTSVELDFTPVTGVRMTAPAAPYTRTTTLDLDLAAQGAVEMSFSLRPDFTDAAGQPEAWVPFATAWSIELPAVDGPHVVYGRFRDAAGNESVPLALDVTLDTAPPTIAALSLVEGAAVPSTAVTLAVTALPGVLDAFEARVDVVDVASGQLTAGAFRPFSPTLPVTLPAPAGDKRVELVLRDAAGNLSPPSSVQVELDPTPPVLVAFAIDGGVAFTRQTQVTLTIDAIGAEQALVSNRGDFAGSTWQPLVDPQLGWSLAATDGLQTVHLRLRDAAGNEASGTAQIGLDRTAPSAVSVVIDLGTGTSRDSVVDLQLAATDVGSGLAWVELDTEASFSGALVVPWAGAATQAQPAFALEPGEGPRTVYARFVDVAGNATVTAASVSVDTLPPLGALAIDGGADYAPDATVSLVLTAPSDTAQVAIVDGATPDCNAARQPFAATIPWTLPPGDGPKSVSVCLFDVAGNAATVQDSIVLDSASPIGTLEIDAGAVFTTTADVTLTFTASVDTTALAIVNDVAPDCAAAVYEPWGSSRAWQLVSVDGARSVTACLRDASGRTTIVSDSIVLDTTAPTATVELDGGLATSTDSTVAVRLVASDSTSGLSTFQLRNDVAFAGAGGAFAASPLDVAAHALVPGDGARTVYARVTDAAGNATIASATLVVDTEAPSGAVEIDAGAAFTQDRDVTLTLTAAADVTQLRIVDGATPSCASLVAFTGTSAWTLPAGDGPKTISVCFADAAGNTATASASITLDTVSPGCALTIDGGASTTRDRDVVLAISGLSADVVGLALADGGAPDCATASYESVVAQRGWRLPATDGSKTVGLCVRDAAGRTSSTADAILLDGTAPAPVTVSIAGGATYATTTSVSVVVAAADATAGLSSYELSLDPTFTGATTTAWPGGASVTLPAFSLASTQGLQTVYTRVTDAAGNATIASDAITLDTVVPAGSILVDGGAAYTQDRDVVLTLTAPADTTQMRIVDGATASCAALVAFAASPTWTVPVGDGTKTIAVCFADAAGNTATATASVVLDTANPGGALSIDAGAATTRDRDVVLTLSAVSADVTGISLADGAAPTCASATYEAPVAQRAWQLPVTDGSKTVGVCFRDAAGRTSSTTDAILLDATAPAPVTVSVAGGAASTTGQSVSVLLSAADATAGLASYELALDSSFTGATVTAWPGGATALVPAFLLGSTQGEQTVYARLTDGAGNVTIASDAIRLDSSAPTLTLAIDGGALYTQDRDVLLTLTAAADVTTMRIVDGATPDCTARVAYAASPTWTVPAVDGAKAISVCVGDAAGNTVTASGSITLDTANPTGTLSVDAGAATTRDRDVVLTLSGLSADVTGISLADGAAPTCASATYEAPVAQRAWQLPTTDGSKTVGVCFRDASGRTSSTTDAILLDGTAPAPVTVSIAGGATYATTTSVSVVVAAADATAGLSSYELSLDPNFTGATVTAWPGGASVTVPGFALASTQGLQTVYTRVTDAAGNATIASDAITLDTAVPVGSILVDGGASYTQDRDVVLTLTAPADTTQMRIVDGATASCAALVAFAASPTWTVPVGDGTKTIAVCFADAAGNTATATASVVLDTANPTGTLSIDAGAATTRDRDVVLTLSGVSADVTGISLADGAAPTCASATYEAPVAQRAWQLPTTDGIKTVGVCFRDASGRTSSATDAILLDATAPAPVTVSVAGGAAYATAATVSVVVAAADATAGLSSYELSLDPNFTGATTTAWPGGASVTLPAFSLASTQGLQTVYTRVTDAAGNATIASDAITLDTQDPAGTVLVNGGATYVTSTSVTLTLAAPADTVSYKVANGAPSCAAPLSAYAASVPHTLAAGDGAKIVSVCFVDAAGRTSTTSTTTILDTTSPAGTISILPTGAYTTSRNVTLVLTAAATEMAIADGGAPNCASATYEPFAPTKSWTLATGEGGKTVGVCFRDAAGLTASNTASIVLDSTPPTVTVSIASGAAYTASTIVAVGLTFPNDVAAYAIGADVIDCATASYTTVLGGATTASTTATLGSGDGTKVIAACVRDAAGNFGSGSDAISLDTEAPGAGSIVLDGGGAWSIDAGITSAIGASGATEMCLAGDISLPPGSDCPTDGWQPFAAAPVLTLTAGDGQKQVNVWFRDAAGNVSQRAADTIVRDGTPPTTGTLTISGPTARGASPTLTRSQVVFAQGGGFTDATSGVTEMQLSEDVSFATAAWQPVTPESFFTLSADDGPKTVHVRVRDAAGNVSGHASATIELDTTAPADATVELAGGATYAVGASVQLAFYASGDATSYSIDGQPFVDCSGTCPSTSPGVMTSYSFVGADGQKTARLVFRDEAGNVSAPFIDTIILDTTPPTAPEIVNLVTRTSAVWVDLSDSYDVNGVDHYEVRGRRGTVVEASADFTVSEGWLTGLPRLREYDLSARAIDRAGNASAWMATTTELDRTVLVGLSTSLVDTPAPISRLHERSYTFRGRVLAPLVDPTAGASVRLALCDASQRPCSESGFTATSFNPISALANSQNSVVLDAAMAFVGDQAWLFVVRTMGGVGGAAAFTWRIEALWTDDPEDLADLSRWNYTIVHEYTAAAASPTSLAAAANGKVISLAFGRGTGAEVRGLVCRFATGCMAQSDWGSAITLGTAGDVTQRQSSGRIELDAGENHLWAAWTTSPTGAVCTYNNNDCGYTVAACNLNATATYCTAASDWAKSKVVVAAGEEGVPHGVKPIELEGKLWLFGTWDHTNPAALHSAGLYLWGCTVGQQPQAVACNTAGSFGTPTLLESMDRILSPWSTTVAPRIGVAAWGASLYYSSIDMGTGELRFGRCNAQLASCLGVDGNGEPNGWYRAKLLDSPTFNGSPSVGVMHGVPFVTYNRDDTTAYVVEPWTQPPFPRGLVPDMATGGVIASFTDRDGRFVDGYAVSYDDGISDSSFNPPFSYRATDPNTTAYDLPISATPALQHWGVVNTTRDTDESTSDPGFAARGVATMPFTADFLPAIGQWTDQFSAGPRWASSSSCRAVAWADNWGTGHVTTCRKALDCTQPGNWVDYVTLTERVIGDYLADVAIAIAPNETRMHLLYSWGWEPEHVAYQNLVFTAGTCAPTVTPGTSVRLMDSTVAALGDEGSHLALTADNNRVYLAYSAGDVAFSPPTANAHFRSCALASNCDAAADFTDVTADVELDGASMAISGGVLYIVTQSNDATDGDAYHADVRRCTTSSLCDAAGDFSAPYRLFSQRAVQVSGVTRPRASVGLWSDDERLLVNWGDWIGWCNERDLTGGCDTPESWNRGKFLSDNLSWNPADAVVVGSLQNSNGAGGRVGELLAFSLDQTGHALGRCRSRCWSPDNWNGGVTLRDGSTLYNVQPESSFTTSRSDVISGTMGEFVNGELHAVWRRMLVDQTGFFQWSYSGGATFDQIYR